MKRTPKQLRKMAMITVQYQYNNPTINLPTRQTLSQRSQAVVGVGDGEASVMNKMMVEMESGGEERW